MNDPQLYRCQCGATWVGYQWQRCSYCFNREQYKLEQYRKDLLNPSWLQEYGPKYWELDEPLRRVWNQTRGIPEHQDVQLKWEIDLQNAVDWDIITEAEHVRALMKWTLMRNSLDGTKQGSSLKQES